MIGNEPLWNACRALATMKGDVRSRVVVAMRIIHKMHPNELDNFEGLTARLDKLKAITSEKGLLENGRCSMDSYQHTAARHVNKTYVKYAEEIFSIWLQTMQNN